MKYVALLSGGKDSCFNLLHCYKNGHELVAAASLGPEPGKEELDSFLYQTVGQDAIETVAHALGVPLHRRVITGSAVEQGGEYGVRDKNAREAGGVQGDETEDLYELLVSVKVAHPDIQGVSVGAILSNYQRVRVEHVCSRIGLTPLTYLWQRDQGELLDEMIEAGMEAILIKVAGIGLTPDHLGKTLAQMRPHFMKLNNLYGSHVCGEGGEYETLTLDCPLFKKRIKLKDIETVIHSDNAFATVAYLRIKDAELQPKETAVDIAVGIPPLLDGNFASIQSKLQAEVVTKGLILPVGEELRVTEEGAASLSSSRVGSWVSVCGIQRCVPNLDAGVTLEDEVIECFNILQDHLNNYGINIPNCTNINIFISSIDLFASINAVYGRYFGTSPPSRACVAVDLPHPIRVRLDCTAFIEDEGSTRQALHVQGLSYWAPANIGPYSQAIVAGERVSISGQIGLIPSNLFLPSPASLAMEFALSSQHVSRVVKALRNGWEGITQSVTYFLDGPRNMDPVKRGHKLIGLPDCPTLFLVVKALPKKALIEKQVLLHTGRREDLDEEGEVVIQVERVALHRHETFSDGSRFYYESLRFEDNSFLCTILFGQGRNVPFLNSLFPSAVPRYEDILSARLFYCPTIPFPISDLRAICKFPITLVPCRAISSIDNDGWDYALQIVADHLKTS